MDQLARIQLQCVIPRLQQLMNLGRLKGIEHHRITEHRTHLGVALNHGANGIGGAHHDQVQAIKQQRLITDAAQQISRSGGIGLRKIFKVVQLQNHAAGALLQGKSQ